MQAVQEKVIAFLMVSPPFERRRLNALENVVHSHDDKMRITTKASSDHDMSCSPIQLSCEQSTFRLVSSGHQSWEFIVLKQHLVFSDDENSDITKYTCFEITYQHKYECRMQITLGHYPNRIAMPVLFNPTLSPQPPLSLTDSISSAHSHDLEPDIAQHLMQNDVLNEQVFGASSGTGLVLNCSLPLPEDIVSKYAYLTCDDVTLLEHLIEGDLTASSMLKYIHQLFNLARKNTFRRLAEEAYAAGCQNLEFISLDLKRQITRKLQNDYSDWTEQEDFSFIQPIVLHDQNVEEICMELYKVFVACALTDPPMTLGQDKIHTRHLESIEVTQFLDEIPVSNESRRAHLVYPSLLRDGSVIRPAQYLLAE